MLYLAYLHVMLGLACFGLYTTVRPHTSYITQISLSLMIWPVILPILLVDLHRLHHEREYERQIDLIEREVRQIPSVTVESDETA